MKPPFYFFKNLFMLFLCISLSNNLHGTYIYIYIYTFKAMYNSYCSSFCIAFFYNHDDDPRHHCCSLFLYLLVVSINHVVIYLSIFILFPFALKLKYIFVSVVIISRNLSFSLLPIPTAACISRSFLGFECYVVEYNC